ncbi:MAG TPA: aspartate kinase [Nitrospinota bacterium]|nr:aspartate kinase [Nitrospinota bacterium]
MRLVIQKYGGTSVGSIEKIKAIAKKVADRKKEGADIIVVVSAMAGETDKLVNMAHQISEIPERREFDMLLSTGERVTIALLTMALQSLGCDAISLTGRQSGIITNSSYTRAKIKYITGKRIRDALNQGKVVVVAGFQGIDEHENVTTLGRGGSDTTAVAIAATLKAEVCEIYTDVEGVFTTDPNIVPHARKLDKISYEEMLEMASLGAKVLHSRCLEFGKKYKIPILVKSTFGGGEGTLVTDEVNMEESVVIGIAYNKNQAKITIAGVPDRPGIAAQIFGKVSQADIVVDMIIQNVSEGGLTDVSFTVQKSDAKKTFLLMKELVPEIGAEDVKIDENITKISIIGAGMQGQSGIATTMFSSLAKENINIMMISTSEIKISCVIDTKYTELAVRVLHDAFGLEKPKG